MIRILFALGFLLSAGLTSLHAQCGCARPVTTKSPVIQPIIVLPASPTVHQHTATPSATGTTPVAGCPSCAKATTGTTAKAAGCAHCQAAAHEATDTEKKVGEEKPAGKAEKETTFAGTLVCAKCGLKEPGVKKCTNALQVKNGEMTITYFLDDEGSKSTYHEGLCGGGTKEGAKVTGVVSEKDGKRWIKASKVEEKK